MSAFEDSDFGNYDLFIKIDDDDIYLRDYVREIVEDYQIRRWDYSGSVSNGILKGYEYIHEVQLEGLGLSEEEHKLQIPEVMPPTIALSRKAMYALRGLEDDGTYEDQLWRRHIAKTPGLRMAWRADQNFVYNIHGENVSTRYAQIKW
jgi:hypothetical protein